MGIARKYSDIRMETFKLGPLMKFELGFLEQTEKNEGNVRDVKQEKSGDEETTVRKTSPRKLLPNKKSAEDEKVY